MQSQSQSQALEPARRFTGRMRVSRPDTDPRRRWNDGDAARNPFLFSSCHWGQLKLLYTEIEFLTLAAAHHDLAQCTVVYAGAAPGHHIALLRKMFPDVRWILVDPARFVAKTDTHVQIRNEFFDDAMVAALRTDAGGLRGRTVLFVSDIRVGNDDDGEFEGAVFKDMVAQQRWGVALDAEMMMLKFRLPFPEGGGKKRDMRYDYVAQLGKKISLRAGVPRDPSTVPAGAMVYLDGEVRLQLYAPSESAEARLVVRRGATGKYAMKAYDYDAYESTMYHFNTVTRRGRFTFPHAALLAQHIAGFRGSSYEGASEAWIASEYLRVVKGVTPAPAASAEHARAVAALLFDVHRDMWVATLRTTVSCSLRTTVAKRAADARAIGRLLATSEGPPGLATVAGMRRALDAEVDAGRLAAETQIASFMRMATASVVARPQASTAKAATPATTRMLLGRADYLEQVVWLREEIVEIMRLAAQCRAVLKQCAADARCGAAR